MFEIVDDDDRRTPDHGYTIRSPGEPFAQVKGSGELVGWLVNFILNVPVNNFSVML